MQGRIASKLTTNSWVSYGKHQATPENVDRIARSLRGSVVEMVAELANTAITTRDLLGLRVGDIITTKRDVHDPIFVSVEGIPKFRASVGQLKGQKAIQVEAQIKGDAPIKANEEQSGDAQAPG